MRGVTRFDAVSPILSAFLFGFYLPELAWALDAGKGVESATDLVPWIIVPLTGAWTLIGAWRAWRKAGAAVAAK